MSRAVKSAALTSRHDGNSPVLKSFRLANQRSGPRPASMIHLSCRSLIRDSGGNAWSFETVRNNVSRLGRALLCKHWNIEGFVYERLERKVDLIRSLVDLR